MANVFLKTLESPWLCNIHGEYRPPPFLIYAQFWWLLVVFSHTHSQYISKVWQYDLSMVKWRKKCCCDSHRNVEMNQQNKAYRTNKRKTNAMVSSKDTKTINANHQTSQWRPPYSVGSPSGGHDVRRQRSRFSDPPPLKVPEATDSANIWCKFWIPHLSFFTRSYILDYKHLGSYVYTQNKQNTYIIYIRVCIYIYTLRNSM